MDTGLYRWCCETISQLLASRWEEQTHNALFHTDFPSCYNDVPRLMHIPGSRGEWGNVALLYSLPTSEEGLRT